MQSILYPPVDLRGQALREVMPEAPEQEVHARFLERMALCHKRIS